MRTYVGITRYHVRTSRVWLTRLFDQWTGTLKSYWLVDSLKQHICITQHIFYKERSYTTAPMSTFRSLQWRHNGRDGVSNHQLHHCMLNRVLRRRFKKTSKLRVTGLCVRGIHRRPVNSPHKWPITRKMFPFDYVIMIHTKRRILLK